VYPDESYEWYQDYKITGNWPYSGGRMDQPWYVLHDFKHWRLVEQWHRINETLNDTTGLPTVDELVERSNGRHE
jgi:hypothetical protein